MVIVGGAEFCAAVHHASCENGACNRMVDAAHRLHLLRRQADLVTGDSVVSYNLSEKKLLNLVGRRKIGKTFKRMKGLSLAMLRRNQFGGISDAAGHMVSSHWCGSLFDHFCWTTSATVPALLPIVTRSPPDYARNPPAALNS